MFVESIIRLLINEHKKSPIRGNVLALGKQTVTVPLPKILEIFEEQDCEIGPNFNISEIKKDETTRVRSSDSIEDSDFLSLFGDVTYHTMDVTDYEQASIIHNLNYPIPPELEGQFDFIIDGGTFDHLFDIKTAFSNIVKLLKPGGRVFQWNAASNYANAGYLSFGADFFHDYYSLNKFSNCRTYFAEGFRIWAQNWFLYEFLPPSNNQGYAFFRPSSFYTMVIAVAEKGINSTHDKMPIQLQYRNESLHKEYRATIDSFPNKEKEYNVKTISVASTHMPLWYKLIFSLKSKPEPSVYKPIGWT